MTRLFSDLGFRWKITLPISALAILLVLMGAVGMRGIERVADSSELLATRHLPAIGLLLNADRDLYQAFVAERSLLDSDAGAHAQALKASHAENLKQAYDRVQKYAAMQPGRDALAPGRAVQPRFRAMVDGVQACNRAGRTESSGCQCIELWRQRIALRRHARCHRQARRTGRGCSRCRGPPRWPRARPPRPSKGWCC